MAHHWKPHQLPLVLSARQVSLVWAPGPFTSVVFQDPHIHLTSTHEMGSRAQTSIRQMETLRQSIFQLLSSSLHTLPLRRPRLGDARVGGRCEELLTVVVWGCVPPPGKQTTSTGSWVKFRSLSA